MKLQSVGEYTDTLMLSNWIPATDFYTPAYWNILSVVYGEPTEELRIWASPRYLVTGISPTYAGYDILVVEYSALSEFALISK